jgi:superfamily II DNA or RNA helicase
VNLRPYQQAAFDGIYRSWGEFRRTLLVLPTGTGKTVVFAHVARHEVENGNRVLILAHRDELIRQAADKLQRATGLAAAVEKADETAADSLFQITVGSVQTLMRPKRLERFPQDYYDAVIVDEAHHCLSESYQRVLRYFDARTLGVTATPDRGDKRNLGTYFEDIAFEYGLRQAIADGFLCRIKAQTVPLRIDLSNVRVTAGDFNDADLGNALDPYLPQIAAAIPADRKTMIFTPLCATAQKMQAMLRGRGVRAYYASGEDRSQVKGWEADGPGSVMLNAMLLNEGYDHPPLDCVCVLRATKSRPFYAQMVGRGTRLAPGKQDLLVLDFLWHTAKHDLCHPASLVAEKEDVAAKMTEIQEAAAGNPDAEQMDLEFLESMAKKEVQKEREEALARELRANQRKAARTVDPLEFALSLHDHALEEYEPVMPWQAAPASEKQIATLARFGFAADRIPNKGFASMLLDRIIRRSKENLASPKQIKLLERFGHRDAGAMTFAQAKAAIDDIAKNGWRRVA